MQDVLVVLFSVVVMTDLNKWARRLCATVSCVQLATFTETSRLDCCLLKMTATTGFLTGWKPFLLLDHHHQSTLGMYSLECLYDIKAVVYDIVGSWITYPICACQTTSLSQLHRNWFASRCLL